MLKLLYVLASQVETAVQSGAAAPASAPAPEKEAPKADDTSERAELEEKCNALEQRLKDSNVEKLQSDNK